MTTVGGLDAADIGLIAGGISVCFVIALVVAVAVTCKYMRSQLPKRDEGEMRSARFDSDSLYTNASIVPASSAQVNPARFVADGDAEMTSAREEAVYGDLTLAPSYNAPPIVALQDHDEAPASTPIYDSVPPDAFRAAYA
jgi:hypothetical protein